MLCPFERSQHFQDPLPSSPPGMCSRQCHTAMCSSWGHQLVPIRPCCGHHLGLRISKENPATFGFPQISPKFEPKLNQIWTNLNHIIIYICRRSSEGPDAFGDPCCSLVSFVPSPKRSRLSHSHLQQAVVVHRKSVHWNRLQSRASMSKVKTRRNRKARQVQSSLQDTELSWHQVTYFTFQDHGFLARGAVCRQFATGLASSTTSDTGYAIHFIGSSADGKLTVALFECKMSGRWSFADLT